ncbi:MAG: ABC transporter permease [Syntrophobacterales bacterium]|jgi:lipoprotein-releasing system permease protein|nr:ABC transporter permease [Syntrophobacterales bacterium]
MNSYELFISLRYLRARRKQIFVSVITFISIIGILLGVATLIIVLAVMNGFETDLRNKILGVNAHVVLMEYGKALNNQGEVTRAIKEVDGVTEAVPFIYGQAMLKSDAMAMGVIVKGVDARKTSQILSIGRMQAGQMSALSEGPLLSPEPEQGELSPIILGKELAKNLSLRLHDTVSMISPTGIPSPMGLVPRIKKYYIAGIFDSGFYEYDSTLVFLSLRDSQIFFGMGNLVTCI